MAGKLDRRELFKRGAALGFSATVLGAMADLGGAQRVLAATEGTAHSHLLPLDHRPPPSRSTTSTRTSRKTFPLDVQIAPVESANADVFIAEAQKARAPGTSTSARRRSPKWPA